MAFYQPVFDSLFNYFNSRTIMSRFFVFEKGYFAFLKTAIILCIIVLVEAPTPLISHATVKGLTNAIWNINFNIEVLFKTIALFSLT